MTKPEAFIKISFVVPAYNEEDLLPRAIASAKSASDEASVATETIVVDNNSSDKTAEIAKACGADKVVFEPVNNIARARNAGAKAASGELLVFLDADSRISGALLSELLAEFEKGGLCAGGAAISFDAKTPFLIGLSVLLFNFLAPFLGFAAGSFSFCLKSAFEACGGFDESLYAGEDLALSTRLKLWGLRRGLRFRVLKNPVESSARRFSSGSSLPLLKKMLPLMLMPWKLRSKEACAHWYDHHSRTL